MSLLHPSFLNHIAIPDERRRSYHMLRALLYFGFLTITVLIGYSFLFPSQGFDFDFRNPDAAKNTLLDPRTESGTPERKGMIRNNATLTVDGGALGIFSDANLSIQLKKDSAIPQAISATVKKGYREIFLPEGAPATFPAWKEPTSQTFDGQTNGSLFRIDGNTYQFFDGILYRFSSDAALQSRYESSEVRDMPADFLTRYPVSSEWIGFRPGSLISFADGVFVVYGETEIRPVGSALIFQAIGYDWNDVIPASEEDIGLYTRGKIILPGTLHAPGTLFQNTDTGVYFTIDEQNTRRLIADPQLLQFFLRHTHAIPVSEKSREISANCVLRPGIFFTRSLTCDIPLRSMRDLPGNDYEFTFKSSAAIGIESISATLNRSPEKDNFRSTLSQLKTRILDRYAN